jgi:predicted metal-dependent phosphoesterase TrpH
MDRGGADLHMHSRHSDGADSPATLVERAAACRLDAISLTDHDTVKGVAEVQAAGAGLGIRILTGAELSADFLGHEVHLLAYGFNPADPRLLEQMQQSRDDRESRVAQMIDRLNQLKIPLTLEQVKKKAGKASLGRPHLADALLDLRVVNTLQEAFDRYLNPGRPAYIMRPQMPLETVKRATHAAGGVLVLAHPHLNLSSGNIRSLVQTGIDGVEVFHPKLKGSQRRELAALARETGILVTGGTDFHGEGRGPVRIGSIRVALDVVDRIEALAASRAPRTGPGQATGAVEKT